MSLQRIEFYPEKEHRQKTDKIKVKSVKEETMPALGSEL